MLDKTTDSTVDRRNGGIRGSLDAALTKAISAQLPLARQYVDRLREKNPTASPAQLVTMLEKHYLRLVTGAGAVVGGAAIVPGFGTAASLAMSAGDVVGFLEATAFFSLALAEVHGIAADDFDKRRAVVLALVLGESGERAVTSLTDSSDPQWARRVLEGLPAIAIQLNRTLGRKMLTRYGARQGALTAGRALPIGIGAAIGAGGSWWMGRSVIRSARRAFGRAPKTFQR